MNTNTNTTQPPGRRLVGGQHGWSTDESTLYVKAWTRIPTVTTFSGGGASAQAGVEGMEGARIMRHLETREFQSCLHERDMGAGCSTSIFKKPSSIHVVARHRSRLRMYLSSLAPHVSSNGPNAAVARCYGHSGSCWLLQSALFLELSHSVPHSCALTIGMESTQFRTC